MSGDPVTTCPMCRYDLSGLPKNHQCPECGFEYDETMLVWYARRTSWWTYAGFLACYLLFIFVMLDVSILGIYKPTTTNIYRQVGAVLVILATTGGYLYVMRRSLDPRTPYLVVTPKKIFLGGQGQKNEEYPWTTVWISDPDKRYELPPWESQYFEQLESKRTKRFFKFLFRKRGWNSVLTINIPPVKVLGIKVSHIQPQIINNLPRRKRKIAMQKIYQIWRDANHNEPRKNEKPSNIHGGDSTKM